MNTLSEIAKALKNIKSAVIFTHTRPDGDTVGSGLALSRALSLLGKTVQVVNDSELPEKFFFLSSARTVLRAPTLDADAYISVDASDETRLGELGKTFLRGAQKGKLTVNIDHHVSNTRFCKLNFVRERASNCENISELLRLLNITPDREIADCLMTGMVTDSGAFSHGDVNGDTFREAAFVSDCGANVWAVTYEMFKKQSKSRAALYAEVVSHLRYFLDDQLVVALVTKDALTKYDLKQDATEGIVDFGLNIDTVEVSVCLLEVGKGQYKASLRSKGRADVNRVAGVYGGGGHILASGCMLFGEIEEIYDRLSYTVLQHLETA